MEFKWRMVKFEKKIRRKVIFVYDRKHGLHIISVDVLHRIQTVLVRLLRKAFSFRR